MSDEVKLEPCGHCGTEMLRHKHCFSHPYPAQGDCILRHYSFDNNKIAAWNRRAAIEATRPTAATDDVVKEELRRLVVEWDGTKEFNTEGLYLFTEAVVGAIRARTGVTPG